MFYVFHGDDTHSQKESLASLLAKWGDPAMLDLNTTRFTGLMPFSQLRQACDAMPFLAKYRVTIVQDLLKAKPDKAFMDELVAYLAQLPESARLIFLEGDELRSTHPFLKLAQDSKIGYAKSFALPEGSALEKWIRDRVAQKNGRFAPQAVSFLAINIGNDLQTLDNEIEKLLLYKGPSETVTIDDVLLLCPYVAEANIFDLVDALGSRNAKKAATLLHQKLQAGSEPFQLFSMFVRQFRLLIQVKELLDAGQKLPDITKELKIHSFVAGKLQQQSRGFSLPQLEQIYRHLLEIDVGTKTGRVDIVTALQLFSATLTTH